MPIYAKKYRNDNRDVLSFSWDNSDNARDKYKKEISFFHNNVSELAETLIELMGDRNRILIIYHPHLHHLQTNSDGIYMNNIAATTIKEVAEAYDISFYNASSDLYIEFNGRPQDFYWNGDMHFNFNGLKLYGELVSKRLLLLITDAGKSHVASDRLE